MPYMMTACCVKPWMLDALDGWTLSVYAHLEGCCRHQLWLGEGVPNGDVLRGSKAECAFQFEHLHAYIPTKHIHVAAAAMKPFGDILPPIVMKDLYLLDLS
jgi:hypothetical protein